MISSVCHPVIKGVCEYQAYGHFTGQTPSHVLFKVSAYKKGNVPRHSHQEVVHVEI